MYQYGFRAVDYVRDGQVHPKFKLNNVTVPKKIRMRYCKAKSTMRRAVSARLPISVKGAALFRPDPNSTSSKMVGIYKRICKTRPPPGPLREGFSQFVKDWLNKNITEVIAADDMLDFYDWIESTDYERKRKDQLISLYKKLLLDPCDIETYSKLKCFVKDEPYDEPKAHRGIYSRVDEFKITVGPFFQRVSDLLFKRSEFIKTVPVADRPTLIKKVLGKYTKFFCTDYVSYESHFDKTMMEDCEFLLYDHMSQNNAKAQEVTDLIKTVLTGDNKCQFDDLLAVIEGRRMSGEMNTSLGNGFSNLMAFKYLCHVNGVDSEGFVEGDDGLFGVTDPSKAPTTEQFAELGFEIKMRGEDRLNTASFCGQVFAYDDEIVLTDPRKALVSFGWTNKRYVNASRTTKLQLLRAKGLSLAHQYNGCPLIGDFGRRIVELTNGVGIRKTILGAFDPYKKEQVARALRTPLPERIIPGISSRLLIEELYGIRIEEQYGFENSLDKLSLDCVFEPTFDVDQQWSQCYQEFTGTTMEKDFPEDDTFLREYLNALAPPQEIYHG